MGVMLVWIWINSALKLPVKWRLVMSAPISNIVVSQFHCESSTNLFRAARSLASFEGAESLTDSSYLDIGIL